MKTRRLYALGLLALVSSIVAPAGAHAQDVRSCGTQQPVMTTGVSGSSASTLPMEVHLPPLEIRDQGWDVCAEVHDPRALDVELEVFDSNPTVLSAEPLCISSHPGTTKRCRISRSRLTSSTLWVRVVPTATIGETKVTLYARALQGPSIGNTGLYSSDAEPPSGAATLGGTFLPSVYPLTDIRSYQRLHKIQFTATRISVSLATTQGAGLLRLSVYGDGSSPESPAALITASVMASSSTSLHVVVPPAVTSGYVLVTLDGRIAERTQYQLSVRAFPSGWSEAAAPGYVYKVALADRRYDELAMFARCRPTGLSVAPTSECSQGPRPADAYRMIRQLIWGMPWQDAAMDDWAKDPSEPLVVFIGIDQLSTTLLIERTGSEFADVRQTVLRSKQPLWAVYIEDDFAQFETTATVVFTGGQEHEQHILEPPGSREALRVTPGARVVRVGMKRFDADRVPINGIVEFSREGPTYPRRNWTRTYRFLDRSKIGLSLGLLITARDIAVDSKEVALIARDLREPGREAEIIHVRDDRPVFATAIVSWPTIRAKCAEERGPWWAPCRGWFLIPNLSVGMGLPLQGKKAYLAALNWPVSGLDALQLTAGIVGLRQQKLRQGVVADALLPADADIHNFIVTEWEVNGVVGLTIDIGAIARRFR